MFKRLFLMIKIFFLDLIFFLLKVLTIFKLQTHFERLKVFINKFFILKLSLILQASKI